MDKELKVRLAVVGVASVGLVVMMLEKIVGNFIMAFCVLVLFVGRWTEKDEITWEWWILLILMVPGFILIGLGQTAAAITLFMIAIFSLIIGGFRWNGEDIVKLLRRRLM